MIRSFRLLPLSIALVLVTSCICAQPDSSRFHFWLGTWDLEWENSKGETSSGMNTIEWTLDSTVIQENFRVLSGGMKGYSGKSWSVYDKRSKTWKQTWVDNQATYLEFAEGTDEEGWPTFERSFMKGDSVRIHQRMVFRNIEENSLDWYWQSSEDGGESWNTNWLIHYTRKR